MTPPSSAMMSRILSRGSEASIVTKEGAIAESKKSVNDDSAKKESMGSLT